MFYVAVQFYNWNSWQSRSNKIPRQNTQQFALHQVLIPNLHEWMTFTPWCLAAYDQAIVLPFGNLCVNPSDSSLSSSSPIVLLWFFLPTRLLGKFLSAVFVFTCVEGVYTPSLTHTHTLAVYCCCCIRLSRPSDFFFLLSLPSFTGQRTMFSTHQHTHTHAQSHTHPHRRRMWGEIWTSADPRDT